MQPLNLTLLQSHTHWHDPAANRSHFEKLLQQVPADTHLVVLPEMFSTGFSMASRDIAETMQGPTVTWLRQQAALCNTVLCGSMVIEDQGEYFNRLLWIDPNQQDNSSRTDPIPWYDKRHRFRMAGEHEHYSAGTHNITVTLGGWRIRPVICYDLRFPVWLRNRNSYDLLLCVANWPAARQSAWDTLLRARAIENQAYVAGVNVLGPDGAGVKYARGSAVYAADGNELLQLADQPTAGHVQLTAEPLQELRKSFPVWQDADPFELTE